MQAQFRPSVIYYEGKHVTQGINKSIHYLSLAANQNDPGAQFNLGLIYYEGEYITRDIDKAIRYLSLAANQNDPKAQLNLGVIYYESKYVTCDIIRAIHYFSLAANQNHPQSQFCLGLIYCKNIYSLLLNSALNKIKLLMLSYEQIRNQLWQKGQFYIIKINSLKFFLYLLFLFFTMKVKK